jgi:hypothetical protein
VLKGSILPHFFICCQQEVHHPVLGFPLLRRNTLLINLHCDSAVGVTQKFLRRFEIQSVLPEHGGQTVPEAMPTDSLSLYANSFEGRSNVTAKNHVWLRGLHTIFSNRWKEKVTVTFVRRLCSPSVR